jgi:tetratricopeptide (TPR) repeat protein
VVITPMTRTRRRYYSGRIRRPPGNDGKSTATEGVVWSGYLILLFMAGLALGLSACGSCRNKSVAAPPETQKPRDLVAECRSLAPEDPYVDDQRAEQAYVVCRDAAQLAQGDAETIFRLGASAFQSDRFDEAVENFHKAEQLGNCKALSFLGDDAWYRQKDATSAENYYKRGMGCGDTRAAAELFSPETFKGSARPELIAALFDSDIEKLNKVRFVNASYVTGFYEALSEQYVGEHFDTCWKGTFYRGGEILNGLQAAEKGDAPNAAESIAYEWALPIAYQVFVPGLGSTALDDFRKAERKAGEGDLIRMVESSKCRALLPYKIVKGIETFAKTPKSLLEVARTSAPNIHSTTDLSTWLRQQHQKQSGGDSPAR